MSDWLTETTLAGEAVTLVPMREEHGDALVAAAADGELFRLWFTSVPDADRIDDYMSEALAEYAARRALPFVVIDNATGAVIGATRFMNADAENRRLEIGYTFYAQSYQRTTVNTECKLLLLSHAFEKLGVIAVEFRTHWHNHASRAAIARLGAKQDGVLRSHQIDSECRLRDTVVFSIIAAEWPAVERSLLFKLGRD